MSLLLKAGISKLSELEIDADKNWNLKGISNIKEIALGMAIGDIVQHDGARLVKLSPGEAHHVLTSEGPGKLVTWAPGGTYFYRYFPVSISLANAVAKVSPDRSQDEEALIATLHMQAYETSGYIRRLISTVALLNAEAKVIPDKTGEKAPAAGTGYSLKIQVGGAVAHDDDVGDTDESAAAQNPTANDMHLLPPIPAASDAYYFGHARKFDMVWLDIGTQGEGVWTIAWEYWNGSAWVSLSDVVDNTNDFTAVTGLHDIKFTRPGDWAITDIGGITGLYWIRGRVSSYTSVITQPLGNQAWVEIFI